MYANGGTLTLDVATLNNAGSINLLGSTSRTTLFIAHSMALSGGGTVSMSGGRSLITDSGGSNTLINVNDKIVGVGGLGGDLSLFVINEAGGVINGNGSGTIGQLNISATVTNAGLIEGTTSQGIAMGEVPVITNSATIAALGTSALVEILDVTIVDSTSKALILASGAGAQVELATVTISGGTLKTSAGGEINDFADTALSRVSIAAASLIVVTNNTLTLNSGTIGAAATIETNDATVIVSGTVTNGGSLFANGSGGLVEIVSGAVVNGGVALIGDGIVEIAGSSGENVAFLSGGSGGLEITDTLGHTSAFSGKVSGFGGSGHSNQTQFIDLVSVTFTSAGAFSSSYASANAGNTSGTLFVSSGGMLVAAIKMVGSYSAGDFHITSGNGGVVEIADPTVPNGGSFKPGVSDIAFGAQTTLAYSQNVNAGVSLGVIDGRDAATIALLGNYMAGSFATTAGGNGGALVSAAQTVQPLLTHPPHG